MYISMAEPDAPAQKRARLDSGNHPVYNGLPFPPPPLPPHTQHSRPPSHPTLVQAPPHSPSRQYPPHSLPPPYPSQTQGPYQAPQPSPLVPPSDIRSFADPRSIPSPSQRPHGIGGPPPVTVSQDRIATYRPPPTPQASSAPDLQRSRSTSITVDVKSLPSSQGMEHGGHHSPWSGHPEHRPNGSISNGYGHTISPPHLNGQAVYPPPPPAGQHYPPPVTPYAPSPYIGDYAASQQVRRKQVRATQACNHCRSRKQKCDEARPCQFCRENNFDCQYKDVPPPKQDRSMMQLQDGVNNIQDVLKDLVKDMSSFKREMTTWKQTVESRLGSGRAYDITSDHASPDASFAPPPRDQIGWNSRTPVQGRPQARVNSVMKLESPSIPASHMSPAGMQASTPIKQEVAFAPPQQPATPADSVRTDTSRVTDSGSKEKSGLQGDHTTPAHKLLEEWQSMNVFYQDIPYLNKIVEQNHKVSDYPMLLEQDRGQLRTWGVGEGHDINDGAQAPGSPESGNDHSDGPSPVPGSGPGKDGLWGYPPLDHSSPATPREIPGTEGGLDQDGRPDFHSKVLADLLESYLVNMHVLHPFMNRSKLKRMFKEFGEQYSPDMRPSNGRSPVPGVLPFNPGVKRKRSTSAFGDPSSSRGPIERSLRNAIVLLVCALGKVFNYTDKRLPAPYKEKTPFAGAWGHTGGSPHPTGSFNSEVTDDYRPRNIDILPGMAYFAYATDILGNQHGGNTVAHAQAMILAALYLSQFARVLESWSWIHSACRITMVLVKADYPKLLRSYYLSSQTQQTAKDRYQKNSVMCVYWTCLQLESDILAEMSTLPPSGISEHQSDIMYPAGVSDRFPTEDGAGYENQPQDGQQINASDAYAMMIYSSQIWLRVILNEAHNALYGASGKLGFDVTNVKEVVANAKVHIDVLESWKRTLPPVLDWNDGDLPPTDLNLARLRAKYYGGLYMMLRPYLRIASHVLEFPPAPATANQYNSEEAHVHMVDLTEDQQKIIEIACKCIESAVRSTIAFDRVGAEPDSAYTGYQSKRTKRLIVTNIFGTLHAQFGNMLVLTSVLKSKLYPRVARSTQLNRPNLTALLQRTIAILEEVSPNSPILSMDLEILRNVQAQEGLR
ncbi:hypothetical protein NX059_004838 [Plenodomus lindquistii]|nr:hypothetical protein NX059_004838 [Plenodomus lindquistii]